MCLCDLYQNDEIIANKPLERWSLNPELQSRGYTRFSDRMHSRFSKYYLNSEWAMVAKEETPVINFDHLKKLLLSQGVTKFTPAQGLSALTKFTEFCNKLDEFTKLTKELKFLDKKVSLTGNKVALCTFPRAGNTMCRKIIEHITGIYTGCDLDLTFTLDYQ